MVWVDSAKLLLMFGEQGDAKHGPRDFGDDVTMSLCVLRTATVQSRTCYVRFLGYSANTRGVVALA